MGIKGRKILLWLLILAALSLVAYCLCPTRQCCNLQTSPKQKAPQAKEKTFQARPHKFVSKPPAVKTSILPAITRLFMGKKKQKLPPPEPPEPLIEETLHQPLPQEEPPAQIPIIVPKPETKTISVNLEHLPCINELERSLKTKECITSMNQTMAGNATGKNDPQKKDNQSYKVDFLVIPKLDEQRSQSGDLKDRIELDSKIKIDF